MKTNRLVLLGVSAIAAACSDRPPQGLTPTPTPGAFDLSTVAPSNVKANFDGDIILTGTGFSATTNVLLNGTSQSAIPGYSLSPIDSYTLDLHRTYAGRGAELVAGDYTVQAVDGTEASATLSLHVRPILVKVDRLRTLPINFTIYGGFADFWLAPWDSSGNLIAPGTELAGTNGLSHANFQLSNARLTPVGGVNGVIPAYQGVVDVSYYDVSEAHPLAVSIAIDMSGSMSYAINGNPAQPSDPTNLRVTAAENFVNSLGPMDMAEVVRFGNNAETVVVPFTSNKKTLVSGLETLRTPDACCSNTPLYDGMLKSVNDAAAMGPGYARAAIVLTDGVNNSTTATTVTQVITDAQGKLIPVFTIGLGNPSDPGVLDKGNLELVADQTGGRFLFASDATVLQTVFGQISALLGSAYQVHSAVNFDPPLTASGTYLLDGTMDTVVDGETVTIPLPAVEVSVL